MTELFGDALAAAVQDAIAEAVGDPDLSLADLDTARTLLFANTDSPDYQEALMRAWLGRRPDG